MINVGRIFPAKSKDFSRHLAAPRTLQFTIPMPLTINVKRVPGAFQERK